MSKLTDKDRQMWAAVETATVVALRFQDTGQAPVGIVVQVADGTKYIVGAEGSGFYPFRGGPLRLQKERHLRIEGYW